MFLVFIDNYKCVFLIDSGCKNVSGFGVMIMLKF